MKTGIFIILILLSVVGCTTDSVSLDEGTELVDVFVSNQSGYLDPVDIAVYLDGNKVIGGLFFTVDAHNWIHFELPLSKGKHEIKAVSFKGDASLSKNFEMIEDRFIVIDFWYMPKEIYGDGEKYITIDFGEGDPGFM